MSKVSMSKLDRFFIAIMIAAIVTTISIVEPVYAEEPVVTSISFSTLEKCENDDEDIEYRSDYYNDDEGNRYLYFYCYSFNEGDKLFLGYSDGSSKEFTYDDEWDPEYPDNYDASVDSPASDDIWYGKFRAEDGEVVRDGLVITSDQQTNHWGLGQHQMQVEYRGVKGVIDVTVYHSLVGETAGGHIFRSGPVVSFDDKTDYDVTWTGKPFRPSVSVSTYENGTLREGMDYTTPKFGNNIDVGYCNVKMEGIGNFRYCLSYCGYEAGWDDEVWYEYPGFYIRPKGTSITKVSGSRKGMKISWKKQGTRMSKKRITGYQVQISADNSFPRNGRKSYIVKGYKHVSKKITKLKARKKYYVRVRTYFTTKRDGTIYSNWSRTKSVRTK